MSVIRTLYSSEFGIDEVSGLVADSDGLVYLITGSADQLVGVTFDEEVVTTIDADVSSPENTTFSGGSLLTLSGDQLTSVDTSTGSTQTQSGTLDLVAPQGMTVDPTTGDTYVLESGANQITRIAADGSTERLPLRQLNQYSLDGLAFNPEDGLLYVAAPQDNLLWGLDSTGKVVTTLGLDDVGLTDLTSMTFAPTADPTDDPSLQSLYIADSDPATTTDSVYEASLTEQIQALSSHVATLVNTTDLSALNPPSSDSSGITYLPNDGWLLFSDSEINEEPSVYQGVNLWELTLDGSTVQDTGTTYPAYSNEPTGVSVNTSGGALGGRLYVSDDTGDVVYDVDPGPDDRYGTADDTFTVKTTTGGDAEGVVYHPSGDIFVVHGMTTNLERITPGSDGIFNDGPGETETVMDLSNVNPGGANPGDPEGIGYNPFADTLLILDDNTQSVYELTLGGSLIRIIDVSASGARNAAGIVLAPASGGGSAWHMYIVDRGIDNNSGGDFVDGALYEMAYDFGPGGGNLPPTASFTDSCTDLTCDFTDTSTDLDGTVDQWSWDFGDSSGTSTAQNPTYTYASGGTYTVTLTVTDNDGESDSTSQDVTVIEPGLPVVTVTATDADAGEPGNNGQFTFTRDNTAGSLTINYTVTGTATNGSDYSNLGGSVTIPNGQPSATEAVTVIDDSNPESAETVIVTIDPDAAYTVGSPSSDTVTITDDDGGSNTIEVRVATGSDDAEQNNSTGSVGLGSTDLELVETNDPAAPIWFALR